MNLRDLQYLVALAEQRHFGRAAEACFVSQPTLSTQIRKLEDELGITLFERAPRHVLLTDAGQRILALARDILADADEIKRVARQYQAPETGTLRLGLFPTLAPYLLPHVIPELHRDLPRLELLLVEEKTDVIVERLRAGKLDAGLLALPLHHDDLHVEFLFQEPFLLAVPASHQLAARRTLKVEELRGQRLLLLEDGHCLRDQALDVCHLTGAGEMAGFRASSLETLRQMVAAEVGITLLPILAVMPPIPPLPSVHLLRFTNHVPHRRIAMVWRKSSVLVPFLSRLAGHFRNLPAELFDTRRVAPD